MMKNLFLLALIAISTSLPAQWIQTGLSGSIISCTKSNGNVLFAGTSSVGIYRSTNNGASWSLINNGLENNIDIRSIAVSGQNLIIGTTNKIFISTNNGDTWVKKETGIADVRGIKAIAANNSTLLASLYPKGVARSIDGGNTWILSNSGLTDLNINCLYWHGNKLFASTNSSGIFVSENNGESWVEVNNGIPANSRSIRSMSSSGNNLYACAYPGGVYKSVDNGLNWVAVNNGIINDGCRDIFANGSDLFVSTDAGIFKSTNEGLNWNSSNTGIPKGYPNTFMTNASGIFVAVANIGVYASTNNGNSWSPSSNGMKEVFIKSFTKIGSTLFGGAYYSGGVYFTSTGGNTWNLGFPSTSDIIQLTASGTTLYAATIANGVLKSNDGGVTWISLATNTDIYSSHSIAKIRNNLFAGTAAKGVFISTNDGLAWSEVNNGLTSKAINMLTPVDTNLFAATTNGLFLSRNNGVTWSASGLSGKNIITLKTNNNKLFAGTWGEGVFVSTDNGNTWDKMINGMTSLNVYAIAFDSNNSIFVSAGANVFVSKNGGATWVSQSQGIPYNVWSLEVLDGFLYAGIEYYGVWKRPLSELLSVPENELMSQSGSLIERVLPNPFQSKINVEYRVYEASPITLKIYSISGAEIATINEGTKAVGKHVAIINSNKINMPDGIYICKLFAGKRVDTVKLIKQR